MAVGAVMVRWVSKYSDPIMATDWHMVIGGLPLFVISVLSHDPAVSGNLVEVTTSDVLALLYASVFGSAVSYGIYFYSATKGSLTKLSSLTFLTRKAMILSLLSCRDKLLVHISLFVIRTEKLHLEAIVHICI